jgi:hypothetical protein
MPTTHTCYTSQHMRPAEYGFYLVCRSLSSKDGVFQFNGRALADQFEKMSKNTPYVHANALERAGWFVRLKDKAKRPGGIRATRQYRVLTHEEWTCERIRYAEPPIETQ